MLPDDASYPTGSLYPKFGKDIQRKKIIRRVEDADLLRRFR